MLKRYIEKNIFRQVYLCQQLYQKKRISIQLMAERLNACTMTINNDLDLLSDRKLLRLSEQETPVLLLLILSTLC